MSARAAIILGAVCVMLVVLTSGLPRSRTPRASELAGMTSEVYVLPDTTVDGQVFMQRSIFVDNTIDSVYRLLVDPGEISNFLPKLKEYNLIESRPDTQFYFCVAKPTWFLGTYECTVSVILDEPHEVRWVRTGGDFDDLRCTWHLRQIDPSITQAVYLLHFDLGGILPDGLVNRMIKSRLEKTMRNCMDWLGEGSQNDSAD